MLSKSRFMFKMTQPINWMKATTLLMLTAILCSCFPERFRHEKYNCSGSHRSIKTIVLNKAEPGRYAKITTMNGEQEASIIQIDSQTAILDYENRQIKINRETGAVTLTHGAKYQRAICKKTVFKM